MLAARFGPSLAPRSMPYYGPETTSSSSQFSCPMPEFDHLFVGRTNLLMRTVCCGRKKSARLVDGRPARSLLRRDTACNQQVAVTDTKTAEEMRMLKKIA